MASWQLALRKDQMHVVGLDIGGANLKAADADGRAVTRPFAVWKAPEKLAAEVDRLLASFARPDAIALTMTAELADCFRTKRDGVDAVLAAVELAAGAIPVFCVADERPLRHAARGARDAAPHGGRQLARAGHFCRTARAGRTGPLDRHRHDDGRPDPAQ